MIDHILTFSSERAAKSALPALTVDDAWNEGKTIPGVTLTRDGEVLPGWSIMVSAENQDRALVALPECVLVLHRPTGNILHSAIDSEGLKISPLPAWSQPNAMQARVVKGRPIS